MPKGDAASGSVRKVCPGAMTWESWNQEQRRPWSKFVVPYMSSTVKAAVARQQILVPYLSSAVKAAVAHGSGCENIRD
jgi:hypothetical protein